jgi:beta-glucosidase/6-phospho-beta-glucosidase/beta-galactosidase
VFDPKNCNVLHVFSWLCLNELLMNFYIFIYFQVASNWLYVYPKGIRDFLIQVKEKYNNPLIYITENGTQINCNISYFVLSNYY